MKLKFVLQSYCWIYVLFMQNNEEVASHTSHTLGAKKLVFLFNGFPNAGVTSF